MKAFKIAFFITIITISAFAQVDRNLVRETTMVQAESRTALVIGNGSYADAPLKNPPNDATDIAATLKGLGFEVMSYTNLDQTGMKKAIREFGAKLRTKGGVGLFYYAGHGVQVRGTNYLIPVGASVSTEEEVEYESVEAGLAIAQMESAKNDLNIVILDACRNNPFARSFRSGEKGLASIDAPSGTLIAYSTAPGSVASDGTGRNGLYTQELLKRMKSPGLAIEDVFKQVRISVRGETSDKQTPWEVSSLTGDFYFTKPGSTSAPTSSAKNPVRVSQTDDDPLAELDAWNKVKTSTTAIEFYAFLRQYPNGSFSQQARDKMTDIGDPEWNEVKKTNDPFKYRAYVKKYPNSPFSDQANERYKVLAEEMVAWERIKSSESLIDVETFIANFPAGTYLVDANAKAMGLVWAQIKSSQSPDVFNEFAKKYPKSEFTEEAFRKAMSLAWDQIPKNSDAKRYELYIRSFPNSPFVKEARKAILSGMSLQLNHNVKDHFGWGSFAVNGNGFIFREFSPGDARADSADQNPTHQLVYPCNQLSTNIVTEFRPKANATMVFLRLTLIGQRPEMFYIAGKGSFSDDYAVQQAEKLITYCSLIE